MAYSDADSPIRDNYYDLFEWNLDKTVKPHVMVRGIMGKDAAGAWQHALVSASNRRVMISGTLPAATQAPLSADSSSISAIQEDAGNQMVSAKSDDAGLLRMSAIGGTAGDNVLVDGDDQTISAKLFQISAAISSNENALLVYSQNRDDAADVRVSGFQDDAANLNVSAKSDDAGLLRMSAIGGTAGDNVLVDGDDQTISAKLFQISATISSNENALLVYANNRDDAADFRLSAFQDDASDLNVSAKSDDAALFRISAIGDVTVVQTDAANLDVSAKSDDGGLLRSSAILTDGTDIGSILQVSAAVSSNENALLVYANNRDDAADFRLSAFQDDAANLDISAKSDDGGLLRTSAVQADAANLDVSAKSDDAALLRASAIQGTASNLNAQAAGDIAHDAADSGNPVKVGMKAVDHSANPTEVAANDRTDWYANRAGIPFVIGGHMNSITREAVVLDADGAQTNTSLVTVAAGNKIVVTRIAVMIDEATTVGVSVRLGFGTASLPSESTTGNNGVLFHHAGMVPGGGATQGDGNGILGIGADNEDLRYTCDDPVDGQLSIIVTYFTVPA